MASKHQITGTTGVFLVAAELSRRDFIVSPTSRSAQGADLLVTDAECRKTYAVQVKTNRRPSRFWLVNSRTCEIVSRNLIYAFVNLREAGAEFFLVPSAVVAPRVIVSRPSPTRKQTWYSVQRADIARFRDKWSVFRK